MYIYICIYIYLYRSEILELFGKRSKKKHQNHSSIHSFNLIDPIDLRFMAMRSEPIPRHHKNPALGCSKPGPRCQCQRFTVSSAYFGQIPVASLGTPWLSRVSGFESLV
jgi:hypothetical protein